MSILSNVEEVGTYCIKDIKDYRDESGYDLRDCLIAVRRAANKGKVNKLRRELTEIVHLMRYGHVTSKDVRAIKIITIKLEEFQCM